MITRIGSEGVHLVTGAAGFVGSHLVARLLRDGATVEAWDAVAWEEATRLHAVGGPALRYRRLDVGDGASVGRHFPRDVDVVWHMAANADIPAGVTRTTLDIRHGIAPTQQILEALRGTDGTTLVFPSTSAVYGVEEPHRRAETDGPFLPVSLYGAAKLACESLISAYCHGFGLSAVILRFGNLVGGGMRRGILHDFVGKLSENPEELRYLGSGGQRKSYVHVDDCVDAAFFLAQRHRARPGCEVYNVAAGGTVRVVRIAEIVAEEMGATGARILSAGQDTSWVGDQPVIDLDIGKLRGTGWRPAHSPEEAVRLAARRLVDERRHAGEEGQDMGHAS